MGKGAFVCYQKGLLYGRRFIIHQVGLCGFEWHLFPFHTRASHGHWRFWEEWMNVSVLFTKRWDLEGWGCMMHQTSRSPTEKGPNARFSNDTNSNVPSPNTIWLSTLPNSLLRPSRGDVEAEWAAYDGVAIQTGCHSGKAYGNRTLDLLVRHAPNRMHTRIVFCRLFFKEHKKRSANCTVE